MYKRKDSDIFGAAQVPTHPRIDNQEYRDPNEVFRKRSESNYQAYADSLTPLTQTITRKPLDASQVNERVNFEENYHRMRKDKDLQSSIFYPPTQYVRATQEHSQNDPLVANRADYFGRKETIKREIDHFGCLEGKKLGNESRLFELGQRMTQGHSKEPLIPLIPSGMQWDQHDSVKYSHINYFEQPEKVSFQQEQTKEEGSLEPKPTKENSPKDQEAKEKYQGEKNEALTAKTNEVEIRVLKGWNSKFMEGLAKHCKLNKSQLLKFEVEGDRILLVLKKSQRWQNVTDWLRKDCKLKIRVMN